MGYRPWGREESDTTEGLHIQSFLEYGLVAHLYQNQLEGMYTCRHPGPCKTTNQGRSLGTLEFAFPMSLPPLERGTRDKLQNFLKNGNFIKDSD